MKKKVVDYIKELVAKEKSLTEFQARTIAYWELVAFTDERKK